MSGGRGRSALLQGRLLGRCTRVAGIEARIERLRSCHAIRRPAGPLLAAGRSRAAPSIEQRARRRANIAALYAESLRLLAPNGEEEGQLRAFERAVLTISRDRNCSIDEAKQLVLDAIANAKEPV